jgi:ABC-2 type transport system permease protein/ribosome-dependent ATPase
VPSVLYSGLLVPIASMDPMGQFEAHLFPAMYYADIVLGSFLKGAGLDVLWDSLLALKLLGAGVFTFGVRRFRRQFG